MNEDLFTATYEELRTVRARGQHESHFENRSSRLSVSVKCCEQALTSCRSAGGPQANRASGLRDRLGLQTQPKTAEPYACGIGHITSMSASSTVIEAPCCRTTTDEQRSTEWMTFESLAEALNPEDPEQTVEGWPAPRRVVLVAKAP